MASRGLFSLASLFCALLVACASDEEGTGDAPEQGYDDELINAEKKGQPSQKWIYAGPLPRLQKPEVVASLKGHTVRVTGLLPTEFTGALPFYAEVKPVGDLRKVTVVYPIATGKLDPSTGQAPAAAGTYNTLFGIAYTPTTENAPWGGFPFVMYHPKRGMAFHGPITSVTDVTTGDLEWRLLRGKVSKGCNRMAGEHIVEMSHLLGMDMTKPYKVSDRFTLSVRTTIQDDYDTFDGTLVDVDYPAEASVERPTGPTAKLYKTWLSDDFPRFVCPYQADRALGPGYCDSVGTDRRDFATGKLLVEPDQTPWIGTSCDAPSDCAFDTGKAKGDCSYGAEGVGLCTSLCEGFCPDKAGAAKTFCASFADGKGRCVAKAEALNNHCADLPGTSPKLVDRFIGTSTAKAAKATVCMPGELAPGSPAP